MALKIKSLGKAEKILVGMPVPEEENGNVGRLVEDVLESIGYTINRKSGCDIPKIEVEVKTRTIEATSAQTVASMTPEDIVKTAYEDSPVFRKIQQQFRVHHSRHTGKIVSAKMYDFRVDEIQNAIKYAYTSAQKAFASGKQGKYIKGASDACGYFEKTVADSNSYDFRFPDYIMKRFESIANNAEQFTTLFE